MPKQVNKEWHESHADMFRAALPHIDGRSRQMVQVMAQMEDLMAVINSGTSTNDVTACDGSSKSTVDLEGLLRAIKDFFGQRERKMIEMILNFFQMKRVMDMMQMIQGMTGNEGGGNPFSNFFGGEGGMDFGNMENIMNMMNMMNMANSMNQSQSSTESSDTSESTEEYMEKDTVNPSTEENHYEEYMDSTVVTDVYSELPEVVPYQNQEVEEGFKIFESDMDVVEDTSYTEPENNDDMKNYLLSQLSEEQQEVFGQFSKLMK